MSIVIHPILPAQIYKLVKDPKTKNYYLEPDAERFVLPPKIYGNTLSYAEKFWNSFTRSTSSMGVMFVGDSGAGKTVLSETLSNIALDHGYMVVMITNIHVDINTINFLNGLNRCVLFFDEFGKNVPYHIQEKMLTMMSSSSNGKKLFIITENEKRDISKFILNRPGRVRYSIYFTKLEKSIIREYANDVGLEEEWINMIESLYDKSVVFSFDHLQAIISEHQMYPEMTLDEILDIMNLELFTGGKMVMVKSVVNKETSKEVEFEKIHMNFEVFRNGITRSGINVYIKEDGKRIPLNLEQSLLESTDNNLMVFTVQNRYTVTIQIVNSLDEEYVASKQNTTNTNSGDDIFNQPPPRPIF